PLYPRGSAVRAGNSARSPGVSQQHLSSGRLATVPLRRLSQLLFHPHSRGPYAIGRRVALLRGLLAFCPHASGKRQNRAGALFLAATLALFVPSRRNPGPAPSECPAGGLAQTP